MEVGMKHLLYLAVALGIICTQMTHAQTWVSLNGPQIASEIRDISVTTNGSTAYIADAHYVLKSTNTGTMWGVTGQPYSNPLLVLVKPNDAEIVHAAINGELVRSTNGGTSWTSTPGLQDLTPLRLVAAATDPTKMLLGRTKVSGNSAIYNSTNSGANWNPVTQFTANTDVYDFAPYPVRGDGYDGVVLAGSINPGGAPEGEKNSSPATSSGLWLSTNYGQSWNENGLGNRNIRSVAIIPKGFENDYIRLIVDKVSGGADVVLRNTSLNDPEGWTEVFSGADETRLIRLKSRNNYLFLATSSGVYRSTDEGETWSPKNSGLGTDTDILSIAPTATGDIVFAGTASTVYKSTDNGDTWMDVGKMNVSSVEETRE